MAEKKTQAAGTKSVKDAAPKAEPAVEAKASKTEAHVAKPSPKLSGDQKKAMGVRAAKKAVQPRFRRHEWWRY